MELKKVLLFVVVPAIIIFGPFILLSSAMMGCYQEQIDKNPNSESAKTWQLRLADICMKTLRPEMAADMYGKFADRYEDDPRRPQILWQKAYAHEKAEQRKEAIDTLVRIYCEHPGTQEARDADERLNRSYQYFPRTYTPPPKPVANP